MDLEYLKEYVLLAEELNFSQVSRQLFISQSALSKHMSALEREIGAELLVRSTHRIRLTPAGEIAYKHFREIVNQYDAALDEVHQIQEGLIGTLSLGFYYNGSMNYLGRPLARFRRQNPQVELKYQTVQHQEVIRQLREKKIDIGICMRDRTLPESDFQYILLDRCSMCAYVSERDRLAQRDKIGLEELSQRTLLLCRSEPTFSEALLALFESNDIHFQDVAYCEQIELVPVALEMEGSMFFAARFLQPAIQPRVQCLDLSEPLTLPLYLIYGRDNPNPCISSFIHCLDD